MAAANPTNAPPSTIRSIPIARPMKKVLAPAQLLTKYTPSAIEMAPAIAVHCHLGNLIALAAMMRYRPPIKNSAASTRVTLSAPASGLRTSRNPVTRKKGKKENVATSDLDPRALVDLLFPLPERVVLQPGDACVVDGDPRVPFSAYDYPFGTAGWKLGYGHLTGHTVPLTIRLISLSINHLVLSVHFAMGSRA